MFDLEPYLLLPLALVLFMMALPIISRRKYRNIGYIQPFELSRRQAAGEELTILDLRPKKEFDQGHIQDAVNVSVREVAQKLGDGGAARAEIGDQDLVLVCTSDLASTRLAGKLEKNGLSGIQVLKGGMHKWKRDHQPIV